MAIGQRRQPDRSPSSSSCAGGPGLHAEWADGEIVEMAAFNVAHQQLLQVLTIVLGLFVAKAESGRIGVQLTMRLPRSAREPDLSFLTTDHLDRLRSTYIDGPVDLAIEIVSPESVQRDHVQKLKEYEEAGIPEYGVLDLVRGEPLFYQRTVGLRAG